MGARRDLRSRERVDLDLHGMAIYALVAVLLLIVLVRFLLRG